MGSNTQLAELTPDDLLQTDSPFEAKQLQIFYQKTPEDKIMRRPGKGGQVWHYVKTGHVIDTLNRVFGYLWSFEILTSLEEAAKMAGSGTVIVKGRLTVHLKNGEKIVKEQFGRCDVKRPRNDDKGFVDLGNDFKGAASDALKKCASEFGLFRDIYHQDDFEELSVISVDEKENRRAVAIDEAKAAMRKAKDINELYHAFISLPVDIRTEKTVMASKNTLKRKLLKKKGAKNENTSNSAK